MLARIQELSQKEKRETTTAQAAKQPPIKDQVITQDLSTPKQSLREEGEIKIIEEITKVVSTQNEQIKALTEQNKILYEGLAKVISVLDTISKPEASTRITPISKRQKKESVLGFRLCQKPTISNGKKYLKWYGYKRTPERQIWVYVGDNTLEAESKIKAWLEKHPEMAEQLGGKERRKNMRQGELF
jgi:hypothetical protein